MSKLKGIRFVTCALGGCKKPSTSPGHEIILDEEKAWACRDCIRKAQIKAMTLTEDLPRSTT